MDVALLEKVMDSFTINAGCSKRPFSKAAAS